MKSRSVLALPILLGLASSASAAVIAGGNGSFETNTRGTAAFGGAFGQIWYLNPVAGNASGSDISGWTLYAPGGGTPNANTAWLMSGATYGAPSDGTYQVNVEGGPDWWLSTNITGLTVGDTYTVFFDARKRDAGGSGTFDISIDTTIPAGGFNLSPSTTTWTQLSITFVANAATHVLTISNTDNPGGTGFMVDNFSVVPEPTVSLLGGLGLLALLRRRRA